MGKVAKTDKKAKGVKLDSVKEGRVSKPSQNPVVKAKEAVVAAVSKKDKKSKKKAKTPTPEPESSDSSEDDSASDASSDEEEVAKPVTNGKANGVKAADSDSDSSDSDSSDSEAEAKPKANGVKVNGTNGVNGAHAADSDSSDDSDASDSDEEVPATKAAAKVASDDSSDSESDSDSSADSSESESEVETPAKANGVSKKAAVEDSSDDSASDSDADSGSDSSSDEEEDSTAAAEAPSKKRKAESDSAPVSKKAKSEHDPRASKNLFIGNIAWGVDEDALTQEFEEFGALVGCRIMTDKATGRSKGFGYVEFAELDDAVRAYTEKQGVSVGGRVLNVDFSEPRPQRDAGSFSNDRASKFGDQKSAPSDTVFLGNLSFDCTNEIVSELFQEHGEITRVSLPTDRETGQPKGFGYVGFSSIEEATAAIDALNGQEIAGRRVRLDFAGPRPENNDSPRGGRGGFGGRGGGRGGGGFGGRGGGGRGGGGFGGRGGGGRGGGRGGSRGNFSSTNRGGFGDFQGKKVSFD